jgi:hypothetical protein
VGITFNFLEENAYVIEHVPLPREDPRLGRLVAHDSRSKAYALPVGKIETARHARHVPVFNQGQIGSCTTNAGLGALGTGIFLSTALKLVMRENKIGFDDKSALELYTRVTKIDEFQGAYPPDDTGSSGNAVGKLFKQLGLIAGWQHALSLEAALTELSQRPVITGVPWYAGFDKPNPNGYLVKSGRVKGGHEFVVDEINVGNEWVGCTNSWGTEYGTGGRFKMSFKLWESLLKERGDVTAFVPLETTPEPTPPLVHTVDVELATAMKTWLAAKGY